MNRACVFAHFDRDGLVDEYVYYYLRALRRVANTVVFVTVVDISLDDIAKLESLKVEVIKRENRGYDFYSYKTGIDSLDIARYDELILCNDSVYGPLVPLERVFGRMAGKECDIWGITDSRSISYHLQGYFILCRKPVLRSSVFSDFWEKMAILDDKSAIVRTYEVGFSSLLSNAGFLSGTYIENISYRMSGYASSLRLLQRLMRAPYKILKFTLFPKRYMVAMRGKNINPSLIHWEKLLWEQNMPFIKTSLFTNNVESKENSKKIESVVRAVSGYPPELIRNHLARVVP